MKGPESHSQGEDAVLHSIRDVIDTFGGETAQQAAASAGVHETAGADARSQCAAMLSSDYELLRARIEAQRAQPDGVVEAFDVDALQRAELALIREAAAARDQERLEELVERLAARRRTPDATGDEVSSGYYIAATAGNRRAKDLLHAELAAEEKELKSKGAREHWLDPSYSPVLKSVVDACVAAGVPADEWIDRHAGIGLRRWGAYMGYMLSVARDLDFPADARRSVERMLASFMRDDMPPNKVNGLATSFFDYIKDPEARKTMMKSYLASLNSSDINNFWVMSLEKMYGRLVREPHLADHPQVLDYLPVILDDVNRALGSPADRRWTVDRVVGRGGSPQEVIERLDLLIGEETVTGDHQSISSNRDAWLGDYAAQYAKKGDFKAAKAFLDAIGTTAEYNMAATDCLKHAKGDQDIAMLQPDETALMVSPARNIPFLIDRARRSGDLQAVVDVMVTVAEDPAEPQEPKAKNLAGAFISSLVSGAAADLAYDLLNESSSEYWRDKIIMDTFYDIRKEDRAQALVLAQRMLAALRQGPPDRNSGVILDLSAEAIHLGDKAELQRRYDELASVESGAARARELALLLEIAPR